MAEFEAYTVIGLSLGGIFALAALGIVLIYRTTGVLNFAQGAMGMFSAFVGWQVLYGWHHSTGQYEFGWMLLSVVVAMIFSLLLGLLLEVGVFRHLAGRPPVVKAVITVGILLLLQYGAILIWGSTQYHLPIDVVPPDVRPVMVAGVPVGLKELTVILVALGLAGGIAAFLRFNRFGIAMRAVSDDPVAASLWGVPVNRVGAASWMLGSLVACVAGILITPFINLDTVSLTLLVLDALAAALIGGLVSLPLTVVGGLVLGLLETYPQMWTHSLGFPKLVAIAVILVVLIFRAPKGLLASTR
jgi:branched-chain amino acid transport system permease protein